MGREDGAITHPAPRSARRRKPHADEPPPPTGKPPQTQADPAQADPGDRSAPGPQRRHGATSWTEGTSEQAERRPGDAAAVVIGALGALVVGLWAQAQSSLDTNLFSTVNDLPNALDGLARACYALGSLWVVGIVVVGLLALRKWSVALSVALAGILAWGSSELLRNWLGDHAIEGLQAHVRLGGGPSFASTNVAIYLAATIALFPYLVRPVRRSLLAALVAVALAAMYLGTALPADVVGGLFLGLAAGNLALVMFGAPGGRPSVAQVREALSELGLDVADVHPSDERIPRAAAMEGILGSGESLHIEAYGRDQRDGQIMAKIWRSIMYREPGVALFGSRLHEVEHAAYAMLLAEQAGVRVPRLAKTGIAGPDAAMLVTASPAGTPLDGLDQAKVTDTVLSSAWDQVRGLHAAGISHGNLTGHHLVVGEDRQVSVTGFTSADVGGERYFQDRDNAAMLVATATVAGNVRAIASAVDALGKERVGELIPLVQPAALPRFALQGHRHVARTLKELRADLAAATGAQDVAPLKIKRLTLTNIGMLVGVLVALGFAFNSMKNLDFAEIATEFQNATWAWVLLAAIAFPAVLMGWASGLMGSVNVDLAFVPTTLTQLGCSFMNAITPNGIGGTALQVDYVIKEGVPAASGGSAIALDYGVSGTIQAVMFVIAIALTSASLSIGQSGGSTLWLIALVAAAVGVVLLAPKARAKVIPAARRAAHDVWAAIRNPRKAMQLFGGNLVANLVYPAVLGLCLLAFGQSLGYAELVVVQIGAGTLASVAPIPGGIGVQEAALTAALTGFGVPTAPAVASVLVFRGVTFLLPAATGYFTLRWLRGKGYA